MNWIRSFLLPSICGYLYFSIETLQLEECENSWFCMLLNDIYNNKGLFGAALFLGNAVVYGFLSLQVINRKRNLVYEVLDNFIQSMGSESSRYRVTIFEECGPLVAALYFVRSTTMNVRYFLRRRCFIFRMRTFPIPAHKYLRVYQRAGLPNLEKRSTLFMAPKNDREVDGIVPLAYYTKEISKAEGLKVDGEKLSKYSELDDLPPSLRATVKRYMKKTSVRNFSRLKLFRKLSGFIVAIPLYCNTKQKTPSHVLVFDGDRPKMDLNSLDDKIKVLSDTVGIILKS
ncbi:hypothetical protein [Marinoscillum luteum]|uniref:Uncharacterized protein n=1 Tax=Marinoscillum luteum TaxID=861051 RepID=A0ABW7NDD3_9BACT